MDRTHTPPATHAGAAASGGPIRVFIVDDNPVIRENLAAALEDLAPVHVLGGADGQDEAVRWLHKHHARCDMLIVDIFLHQGSGMEVLRAAQGADWNCVVVVLTNYINDEIRAACTALGAERVFDKSWDLEHLTSLCTELHKRLRA